jgi:peptidoglycan/LPS O-acetylase OafA/YrhL
VKAVAAVSAGRIPSLDGLRALSILLVLVGHLAYSTGAPIRESWLTAAYAHHGVRIFFIISGFLITTLLLREREKAGSVDLKQFYIRRAYRILPVAYIYLFAVTIVFYNSLQKGELVLAYTYLSSYGHNLPWVLSHLWSLSVEEQFYFVWPALVALGSTLPRRLVWTAIVISPLCRFVLDKNGLYQGAMFFFPSISDSLASGCLLALLKF